MTLFVAVIIGDLENVFILALVLVLILVYLFLYGSSISPGSKGIIFSSVAVLISLVQLLFLVFFSFL